jgi:hypothetical protein
MSESVLDYIALPPDDRYVSFFNVYPLIVEFWPSPWTASAISVILKLYRTIIQVNFVSVLVNLFSPATTTKLSIPNKLG